MQKKLFSLMASLGLLLAFGLQAGCSTIEGAGKDLSKAGEAIREAAQDAQN
ncbi:entericidin A/B family lipoprotein [Marinobacterium sp. AK62]|uniref:Entericidin A/B family lipoprotein n=1 Tax=Marinobacterium alkalitolerans TaxID=1542925 RepID=A0ABS3Z616_9GAMM|nr:entericidin A/B family lipoprotein [Marinobacterium alkalitolerans]MBP0047147.1 entericidin A/B family lipoprotein [Marinobacterium alkalitolerans]